MPNYEDNLNYSAQQSVWENIDWETIPFDGNRLKSPLTPEEQKDEEHYKSWGERYNEEYYRKYFKWSVNTNSDFWNSIANATSSFVSRITSPFTMQDNDTNYKDEVEYKVNVFGTGSTTSYDAYITSIHQYRDFIDNLSLEFIKTGYYNLDVKKDGKIVDFDDDTYESIANKITDKIIPRMMFQYTGNKTLTIGGEVNLPDNVLYSYNELDKSVKANLKEGVKDKIKDYLQSGYKNVAKKIHANNVIRSNTKVKNPYWNVLQEAEFISDQIALNNHLYTIKFKDPETGSQMIMSYSDFIEKYGTLNKEDIIGFDYPGVELRSYAVKIGKDNTSLGTLSLRTDFDSDVILEELRALNQITLNNRNDLFTKNGTPTCEMSQICADEGYNLMIYYLKSGHVVYDNLKLKKEYLDEFNENGYKPGYEYDQSSKFYHLREENINKYDYVAGNVVSRLGEVQINAMGITDEEEVQNIKSWKFTFHNNAITTGENKVSAGTVTIESGDGKSVNMTLVQLRNLFNNIARSDQNNRYKKMSQIDEDEINAGTDYSKFLHSIAGNYIRRSGFSPKDKNTMTDVGFFAAMNGLKRSDGSLYDVYDILMSDGIEYIDTKSENRQYDFQDRDLLIFRKTGQKHNVVSIANGNVYTLGNGNNQPQIIPIQDYINIMNKRGYSLYRYRFEGNFDPQTARFNLEEYFNIY